MINYGKLMCEAVCPLCANIYIMEASEVVIEEKVDDKEHDERAVFYCEDCERRVRAFKWKYARCSHDWLNDYHK